MRRRQSLSLRIRRALATRCIAVAWETNEPGDGFKFRGRGCIQITGRDNYTAIGKSCGLPLIAGQSRLGDGPAARSDDGWDDLREARAACLSVTGMTSSGCQRPSISEIRRAIRRGSMAPPAASGRIWRTGSGNLALPEHLTSAPGVADARSIEPPSPRSASGRAAIFHVEPHYLLGVAQLRSGIADDRDGESNWAVSFESGGMGCKPRG